MSRYNLIYYGLYYFFISIKILKGVKMVKKKYIYKLYNEYCPKKK